MRWSPSLGREDLPVPGGLTGAFVTSVSGDGNTVSAVGTIGPDLPTYAFRQRFGGDEDVISPLPGYERKRNTAIAISRDGGRVVGYNSARIGFGEDSSPWIWSPSTGTQPIPGIPSGSIYMRPTDISDDGLSAVGDSSTGSGESGGWLWREGIGTVLLTPPSGMSGRFARTISGDGRVVGGGSWRLDVIEAVIWRDGVGMSLGTLSDFRSATVMDMSDNGSIVVGYLDSSASGQFERAFVWTESTGMLFLEDYLIAQSVPVPTDVRLVRPVISGDGLTIAGDSNSRNPAFPPGAFAAIIPAPAPVCLLGLGLVVSARRRR